MQLIIITADPKIPNIIFLELSLKLIIFLYNFSFKFWELTKYFRGFYKINYIKYVKDFNKKAN